MFPFMIHNTDTEEAGKTSDHPLLIATLSKSSAAKHACMELSTLSQKVNPKFLT